MVNPLDKLEFQDFLKIVKNTMPKHTEYTAKIPNTQFGNMPKNLMEFSAFKMNKFLNNHQHTIEERLVRNPKDQYAKVFKNYALEYYKNFEILNHDNFYQAKLRDQFIRTKPTKFNQLPFTGTVLGFGTIVTSKVLGTEVETDGNTGLTGNNSADFIEAGKCTTFIANAYYDQMKFSISAAAGNIRVCLYDDNSNEPNNLVGAESGSVSPSADYTTIYSIGEGQMPATTGWMAHNQSSGSLNWGYWNNGGTRNYKSLAFGAMPNPLTGTSQQSGGGIPIPRMKALHS